VRSAVLRICEALLIFTTLLLAHKAESRQSVIGEPATYAQVALVESVILLCMYCLDFYEPQITTRRAHSFSRLFQVLGLTMLIVAALRPGFMPVQVDSAAVLIGILLVVPILAASRYLFAELACRPILADPAIVWGAGPLAANLIHELRNRPDIGIRVLGVVDAGYHGQTFTGVRNLGAPDVIWKMAECGQARRVIIAIGERRGRLPVEKLMELKAAGFKVDDGAELYEGLTGKVWLDSFTVSSLLFSHNFKKSSIQRILNRSLSLFFATIALIAASPVMLLIAALIRLDSKGPAIFRQARVGENGRYFTLFKFRSMRVGSESAKVLAPATLDDPRCTRVGKWLRRYRLDELPQLFNIIKGDMYFVGPRPFVPGQETVLVEQIPNYRQRWIVRPGTTGWAQVHRGYNASLEDNVDKLSYDLFYIKNMSLGLDLLTIMKTFKIVLLGRGGR
jgi:exopolysaccharide biosynthesis polyprenyl glycosylphosphotransferase